MIQCRQSNPNNKERKVLTNLKILKLIQIIWKVVLKLTKQK